MPQTEYFGNTRLYRYDELTKDINEYIPCVLIKFGVDNTELSREEIFVEPTYLDKTTREMYVDITANGNTTRFHWNYGMTKYYRPVPDQSDESDPIFYFPTNSNYWFRDNYPGYETMTQLPEKINDQRVTYESTKYIISAWGMFEGCNALTSLPDFDFSSLEDASNILGNYNSQSPRALTTIDEWKMGNTNIQDMGIGYADKLVNLGGFPGICGRFSYGFTNLSVTMTGKSLYNILSKIDYTDKSKFSDMLDYENGSKIELNLWKQIEKTDPYYNRLKQLVSKYEAADWVLAGLFFEE